MIGGPRITGWCLFCDEMWTFPHHGRLVPFMPMPELTQGALKTGDVFTLAAEYLINPDPSPELMANWFMDPDASAFESSSPLVESAGQTGRTIRTGGWCSSLAEKTETDK